MKFHQCLLILSLSAILSACGGSSTKQLPPPPGNFAIGGSVMGLSGTGLVLLDNGGANLSIAANGTFTFASRITALGPYNVTVLTQPSSPTQFCTVTGGSGTASSDITTVLVTCASTFTIGGTVSGLTGTGLIVQNNAADNLSVTANGTFTFATPVTSGGAYAVTVLTQPSSPAQACTVTNGSGNADANVTNVSISCAQPFNIGGTVSGLAGSGLILRDNGGDNLAVNANGSFTFSKQASTYNVTVFAQPSNPVQVCSVTNGSGTATADVTNVQVSCSSNVSNEWTWMGGDMTTQSPGNYGVQGVAAPTNVPGARQGAVGWKDSSGSFWLFGGFGAPSSGDPGDLDDLWRYSAGEWTWVAGPEIVAQPGIYGTQGQASAANVPGSRTAPATWIDSQDNLWLFGGAGSDSNNSAGELNDLWKFSAGEWTWINGSNSRNQTGIYGTKGTADPGNVPGARDSGFYWTDSSGSFWLFGGDGFDSAGTFGQLNDLWKYSSGEWTWVGGSNVVGQLGSYGTQGVASPNNFPGARDSGSSATDPDGNLWLFGGRIQTSGNQFQTINDLWKYSSGQWTWVSGSNLVNQGGQYGTQGIAAPTNAPSARRDCVMVFDSAGNLWLFGGPQLSDLWKFSGGEWTWVSGSNHFNQAGVYGTLGTPSPNNFPGSRGEPVRWIDSSDNIWIFGGLGTAPPQNGNLNDLWRYTP